jgi:hypothetical protein
MISILLLILCFIIIGVLIQKEGFKDCEQKMNTIQNYPKKKHIDLLYDAKFRPECCPTPYSTSSGCLCTDTHHADLIIMRGGNRSMCS